MTDSEIIQGLIDRDNRVTRQFFFEKCRPLFLAIMRQVFDYPVDYNEMVNELYAHLMDNDAARLRQFGYRSTVYQWIKVVATRFFIRHRDSMIENASKEPHYEEKDETRHVDTARQAAIRMDVDRLLELMPNRRYADVVRRLIIEDMEPERYAEMTGVTLDNLYNIKKRALASFTKIALIYYRDGR